MVSPRFRRGLKTHAGWHIFLKCLLLFHAQLRIAGLRLKLSVQKLRKNWHFLSCQHSNCPHGFIAAKVQDPLSTSWLMAELFSPVAKNTHTRGFPVSRPAIGDFCFWSRTEVGFCVLPLSHGMKHWPLDISVSLLSAFRISSLLAVTQAHHPGRELTHIRKAIIKIPHQPGQGINLDQAFATWDWNWATSPARCLGSPRILHSLAGSKTGNLLSLHRGNIYMKLPACVRLRIVCSVCQGLSTVLGKWRCPGSNLNGDARDWTFYIHLRAWLHGYVFPWVCTIRYVLWGLCWALNSQVMYGTSLDWDNSVGRENGCLCP